MAPQITITTEKGTETIEISKEAMIAAVVPISLAHFDPRDGQPTVSKKAEKELSELARAFAKLGSKER